MHPLGGKARQGLARRPAQGRTAPAGGLIDALRYGFGHCQFNETSWMLVQSTARIRQDSGSNYRNPNRKGAPSEQPVVARS